jgi:hypothetical protein
MRDALEACLWTVGLLLVFNSGAASAQMPAKKIAVSGGNLCVTEGAVTNGAGDRLTVDAPKMRAYVNTWTSQAIEAKFTYVGPTAEETKLGSGEIRRQFGLKLRAQNACNLVYAMWRIEPESKIVVSIKRNPDQTKSSECGNRGYQNIKPQQAAAVPALRPGDAHTLGAELEGNALHVFVDNRVVWEGNLGPEADGFNGPVGIRSDNVRLAFDLKAGATAGMHPDFRLDCKSGPDASD